MGTVLGRRCHRRQTRRQGQGADPAQSWHQRHRARHSTLAQALARNGYLVAALRHPGDNYQDRSLLEKGPERYFDERPRQASRVIDAILADPA